MENNNTLGLIFSENPEANLGVLMNPRALAAVPVGGRYRIIDFMLSNMVNSGIASVGITTGHRHQSLNDHLGSGKAWDMARKEKGLFILPPPENTDSSSRNLGGIDNIESAMRFLKRSHQEYVLISDCNTICNINFEDVMEFHMEKQADITIIYTAVDNLNEKELKRHIMLNVSEDGRVEDMQIYPKKQKSNFSYMHMLYIKKELLIDLVDDCLAHDEHIISKDILLKNIKNRRIFGYEFKGYRKKIDSIKSFFEFNLDLLNGEIRQELFGDDENSIYTKVKDSVPTRYGKNSEVKNSFIADGCFIDGEVENCIIFRGVKVGRGSKLKNAVIMQNSQIMENCVVENVIFDKEVVLCENKKMIGQETYPLIVGKRTVV